MDFPHAPLTEVDVAHGKRLIHQKDLGIDMDRDCERQAHRHAAGIRFHWLIDESADFGECCDFVVSTIDFLARQARESTR